METFGLTPLQQGMYYHHLLEPDSGVHLEQIVLDLPGDIDPRCLEAAWNLVIGRHEILRAGFELRAAGAGPGASHGPAHCIHGNAAIEFSFVDWSGVDAEWEAGRYLERDRRRPFDLRTPPLMRVLLAQMGPGVFRLLLTLHHIIIDGPSLDFRSFKTGALSLSKWNPRSTAPTSRPPSRRKRSGSPSWRPRRSGSSGWRRSRCSSPAVR